MHFPRGQALETQCEAQVAAIAAAGPQIEFYDNEVPAFVEAELERLYECVMTTVARFAIYEAAPHASTYVVREAGRITTLFLFRREGSRVQVYNEQMPVAAQDINRFADAVFARYRKVRLISFYAISTKADAIRYPLQLVECLEDIRMPLPASGEAYMTSLGKNTRAAMRRALRQIQNDHPSFRVQAFERGEASEQLVRQIIAFNRSRMTEKGQVSCHTEQDVERLLRLVQKYGVVVAATIESRICGGAISFRVGSTYHLYVLAHDSRYNAYQLGKLCCYFSVCDAIERGDRQYHFGWGRYDYKFKLLGRMTVLHRVDLYRSRLQMMAGAARVAQVAAGAMRRRFKQRIADAELGESPADRWILNTAQALRAPRQLLARMRGR
ncbi:GNAT family N-acetyltransferase [Massilia horti]|uniref:GNAT family N-acetyltransferase n=1 Tax=Massilia horti TaxID=2562153 RepID=A0A4Y9SXV7_9BURK|nr:GNAT family N-acetyltransferase [Massilia horti]TFW31267.1 GNAT family N-acetyltransferase [Massilia horti]